MRVFLNKIRSSNYTVNPYIISKNPADIAPTEAGSRSWGYMLLRYTSSKKIAKYCTTPPYLLSDKTRVQRPRSSLDNVTLDMDGDLQALYIDFAEAKPLPREPLVTAESKVLKFHFEQII